MADLRGVVGYPDRLGMGGAFGAYRVVIGVVRAAAWIAGDGTANALHMLEHALHAPETTAREHRGFGARSSRCRGEPEQCGERAEGQAEGFHRRVSFVSLYARR